MQYEEKVLDNFMHLGVDYGSERHSIFGGIGDIVDPSGNLYMDDFGLDVNSKFFVQILAFMGCSF